MGVLGRGRRRRRALSMPREAASVTQEAAGASIKAGADEEADEEEERPGGDAGERGKERLANAPIIIISGESAFRQITGSASLNEPVVGRRRSGGDHNARSRKDKKPKGAGSSS